jgi:S-adenosylmethionine synthetase
LETRRFFFTSESVGEGHPDKLCDQVSDAILDSCLAADPQSRVACETFASTSLVLIGGEITTNTFVDFQTVVRDVVKDIGYTDPAYGLDYQSMAVLDMIHSQSPDISQGVSGAGLDEYKGQQGAGDQGMMFGFACSDTPELMPLPITLAHKILIHAAELRKTKALPWLRPDAKSQVTVEYEGHKPVRIDAVVVSQQHDDGVSYNEIRDTVISRIVKPILEPTGLLDEKTKYYINPTGRFVVGGPFGDTGLTGRKIIVDTYGGMARHGGGAFSGKDPSKVDRSAAYAIGRAHPVGFHADCFGTERVPLEQITAAVREVFDLRPAAIIRDLDLIRPIYSQTTNYGHFGRDLPALTWERTDRAEALARAVRG